MLALCASISAQTVPEKSSGGKTKWYFIKSYGYSDCYLTANGDWVYGIAKAGYDDPETMAKQLWCFTTDDDSLYTITCKYDGRVFDLAYHPVTEECVHFTSGEGIKFVIRTIEGREGFGLMTDRPCPSGNPIMRYPSFAGSYNNTLWLVREANSERDEAWFIAEAYDEGFETQNSEEVIYYNIVSSNSDMSGRMLADNTSSVDSKYKFVMQESAADNPLAQWRLVRCKNQTVAIVNRATGNSISNSLEADGYINIPNADGKEIVPAGYNISKISDDFEFVMSSVGDDGIVRYLNAANLAGDPAVFDRDNLNGSVFAWRLEQADQAVAINGVSNAAAQVSVVDGRIVVPQGVDYKVYSADGIAMPKNKRLPNGIYMVTAGGKTVKIFIH